LSYFRLILSPPLPCFCRCGRKKLSKFNLFKPNMKMRFFFLMFVYSWLVFLLSFFLGNFDWQDFFLMCVKIIWTLYI
jgi:hypothetical protein